MKITEEKLKKILTQEAKKILHENNPDDWSDDEPQDDRLDRFPSSKKTPEYEYEDEPLGTDRFGLLSAEGDPDGDFDYENDRWRDPPKVKKPWPKVQKPVWIK